MDETREARVIHHSRRSHERMSNICNSHGFTIPAISPPRRRPPHLKQLRFWSMERFISAPRSIGLLLSILRRVKNAGPTTRRLIAQFTTQTLLHAVFPPGLMLNAHPVSCAIAAFSRQPTMLVLLPLMRQQENSASSLENTVKSISVME